LTGLNVKAVFSRVEATVGINVLTTCGGKNNQAAHGKVLFHTNRNLREDGN